MLHLYTADRVEPLARHLAELLADVPADPLAPEWVAVPSEGMRRWLTLELARTLGASAPGRHDGVAANIHAPFPGALRSAVLQAGLDVSEPWTVDRLSWAILAELDASPGDPELGPLAEASVASRYARARRVADLFDRYEVHRPTLVRAWAAGRDVGPSGGALDERRRWQPMLWRRVRRRLGVPSPAERLPGLLDRLVAGDLELGLPDRLVFFGLSVLPGGADFLPLAAAVSARRDVHLYLLEPSPVAARHLAGAAVPAAGGLRLRTEVDLGRVRHPLLRSWSRAHAETAVLVADAVGRGVIPGHPAHLGGAVDRPATTLLGRLQADLAGDRAGTGDFRPDPDDRSVQFHACHGPARQVEVARDVLCHLLADDPTLSEDDIVVVCPALDELAPLVTAVLGPPAGEVAQAAVAGGGPPVLRYRLADRSLRSRNPLLAAVDAVLALAGGRFTVDEVLDVLALPPVRLRLHLTDLDLDQIDAWARRANVRWGLDSAHRARFGVPAPIDTNSWQDALDRLLVGLAVAPAATALAVGDLAALEVDGDDAERAGRLADAFDALRSLAAASATERPLEAWLDEVEAAATALVAAPPDEPWQADGLTTLLADLREEAAAAAEDASVALSYTDLRRLLADRLAGEPERPGFFRGGMVVTSLRPLRWVPTRVVCLLGADEAALKGVLGGGDDLLAQQPAAGDPDGRAEVRQALLETVLAARDVLVVVRDGSDVRTGRPVPPATPVAELRDAVLAAVDPDDRPALAARLEVEHPHHGFDPACYEAGAILPGRPFGFDPHGLAGAVACRHDAAPRPFLTGPLPERVERVVDLAALHRFLADPTASFLRDRLRLHLHRSAEVTEEDLPVEVTALVRWQLGERLVAALLAGADQASWERVERRSGSVPPGSLGRRVLDEVAELATAVVADARAFGVLPGPPAPTPVDVELDDGTRVVGTVDVRLGPTGPGPAMVGCSRLSPRSLLRAWLDLVALVATDTADRAGEAIGDTAATDRTSEATGGDQRRAVVVGRSPVGSPASAGATAVAELRVRTTGGGDEARRVARAGLAVAVDCYRRGLRAPIPLFPTLSYYVHRGSAADGHWRGSRHGSAGDGDGPARLVYGDLDLAELLALPAWPGDPAGPGGRVERFAHYLWGAVDASAVIEGGTFGASTGAVSPSTSTSTKAVDR
ncbi:MAG: exodeoxyribonuclease V subunit gamma [Actinomycetota bacterium]|nr:exodeoxyribonuclease V subunit gamma [Actinomycetota bacterium]